MVELDAGAMRDLDEAGRQLGGLRPATLRSVFCTGHPTTFPCVFVLVT
ncbi:hypothetical protein [Micromonospora noduli]|nr:hypothetical protein [Micromonospora noduli]